MWKGSEVVFLLLLYFYRVNMKDNLDRLNNKAFVGMTYDKALEGEPQGLWQADQRGSQIEICEQ